MDTLDRDLLAALSADARAPVSTLARRLKVARSTVQARIERLENSGAIAGYTVRLGEGALAGRIRATVLLSIEPRSQATVVTRLRALTGVERLHTTSGRFDLLLQIAARDTTALDTLLDDIGAVPGIRSSESLIHLSTKLDRAN